MSLSNPTGPSGREYQVTVDTGYPVVMENNAPLHAVVDNLCLIGKVAAVLSVTNNAAVCVSTQNPFAGKALHGAEIYIARRERKAHPEGTFDKAGRWYPSTSEKCVCCFGLRQPSRRWPYSQMTHCRTFAHVAKLMDVSVTELRAAVRYMDAALAAYQSGTVIA